MKLNKRILATVTSAVMCSVLAVTASAYPSKVYNDTFNGHDVTAHVYCNNSEGFNIGGSTTYEYSGADADAYVTVTVVNTTTGATLNTPVRYKGYTDNGKKYAFVHPVVEEQDVTIYSAHEVIFDDGTAWSKYLSISATPGV